LCSSDDQTFAVLFKLCHQGLVRHFPCPLADISGGKVRLAKKVQSVGFDNQMAFAACTALIATCHEKSCF